MNDFKAEPQELRDAMLEAAKRVLESGWYVLGNEVAEFEKRWANSCGVAHGVGVGNGMDAIEIALRSMDIGLGDEVITTSMTAFATVLAILRAGAVPVLADINLQTGLMSLESTERCYTPNTKAILLVHLYGQVRGMDEWIALSARLGVTLIEDCAQAHLATWHGKVAGSFGAAGAYSFYPTKNLGAPGDAGMLVTKDDIVAQRAARLRNYGQNVRYYHSEEGMNSRLDEIHAAMLSERLEWLQTFTDRRRNIADAYHTGISNKDVRLLSKPEENVAHVYHLFVVTCSQREALSMYLNKLKVQSLIHYPIPVHQQEPCKELRCDPEGLTNCEQHAATCLSLPCHPQMTDQDIERVIDAVNKFQG